MTFHLNIKQKTISRPDTISSTNDLFEFSEFSASFLGQQDNSIRAVLQERTLNFCALWIIDSAIVRSPLDEEMETVMFYADR